MRRACSLLSGGKDSNYALYTALREGYEITCILAVRSAREDSWMFHTPYTSLVELQASAMGLEHVLYWTSVSGVKEKEVDELANALEKIHREIGFDTIVVGALASRYQYERIARIARKLGVEVFAPYWQSDPINYMYSIVRDGIRFIIVKISVMGLPERLLGVPITEHVLENIINLSRRYGFHPAFEGGEAETLVYDAPHYMKKLCIRGERKKIGMYEYILDITNPRLSPKDESRCVIVDSESYP